MNIEWSMLLSRRALRAKENFKNIVTPHFRDKPSGVRGSERFCGVGIVWVAGAKRIKLAQYLDGEGGPKGLWLLFLVEYNLEVLLGSWKYCRERGIGFGEILLWCLAHEEFDRLATTSWIHPVTRPCSS
jgi:hypothetical protein